MRFFKNLGELVSWHEFSLFKSSSYPKISLGQVPKYNYFERYDLFGQAVLYGRYLPHMVGRMFHHMVPDVVVV